MKIIAYARIPDEAERDEWKAAVQKWAEVYPEQPEIEFEFDGLAGQMGLSAVLKRASHIGVAQVLVNQLSDLGRDSTSLISNAHEILFKSGTLIRVFGNALSIEPGGSTGLLIAEIYRSHSVYSTINRKVGQETARAAGAQIGRPRGKTLADVQETIERLMNANEGKLPSTRKFAKEADVSIGSASRFLKEYREKSAATGVAPVE